MRVEKLEKNKALIEAGVNDQERRIIDHLETINKMETDLAKVRTHVGTAAFNECLKEKDAT